MANEQGPTIDDMSADLDNLFREETFTDGRAASVRRLTPVTPDGDVDPSRDAQFIGDTTLMTQMGPIPVQFILEVTDLKAAFEACPPAEDEAFIIGGGQIYDETMAIADRIYLTVLPREVAGDTYFSEFDESEFEIIKSEFIDAVEPYHFYIYERVRSS